MRLFLHNAHGIRIVNGDAQWTGSFADFLTREPTYPGLGSASVRYNTPEYSYLETAGVITTPDPLDCAGYIDKADIYTPITYGDKTPGLVWVDANTITVTKGRITGADGITVTLTEDITILLSHNRPHGAGDEAANTKYYVVVGTNSAGNVEAVFHTSETTSPNQHDAATPLLHPAWIGCVRNNSISNITPFHQAGTWQYSDADVACTGTDEWEVFDGTLSTTWLDVDCSPYMPLGIREVLMAMTNGGNLFYVRGNGTTMTTIPAISTPTFRWYVINGIFEAKNNASATTRLTLIAFSLR